MKHCVFLLLFLVFHSLAFAQYDSSLAKELSIILNDDQKVREEIEGLRSKYPADTMLLIAENKRLTTIMKKQDSINLIKVVNILNSVGWPAPEVVGQKGSNTPFWIIQHAGIDTQVKYLPLVRRAVSDGKVSGENLALLEDRVLLGTGKRQLYGTQIGGNIVTNEFYVMPLNDPDNVDKRRASIGLEPLSQYITDWNITWDVDAYKKRLPELDMMYGIKEK